jgi:biofilm PGA synthesis N-glycosyltransferase PgaC
MSLDGLRILTQLDIYGLVGMFWYATLLEIPRFALGLIVVSGCSVLKFRRATRSIPKRVGVSVLLAGHNEESVLRRAVRALGEQTRKDLQVVVVDDGSTDRMAAVGRRLQSEGLVDVFISTGLRSGKSAALNLGLTFCTGDLVIVGDIDTSFDRYAIERVIEPFVDPSVGGVSGNIGVRNYRTSVIASLSGDRISDHGLARASSFGSARDRFDRFRRFCGVPTRRPRRDWRLGCRPRRRRQYSR